MNLLKVLKDFENLEGFLEHVSLVMENISNTSRRNTYINDYACCKRTRV